MFVQAVRDSGRVAMINTAAPAGVSPTAKWRLSYGDDDTGPLKPVQKSRPSRGTV